MLSKNSSISNDPTLMAASSTSDTVHRPLFWSTKHPWLRDAGRLPKTKWWYDRAGDDPTGGFKKSTHALTKKWDAIDDNKNRPSKRHAIAKGYEEHMLACRAAIERLVTAESKMGFLERFSGCDISFLAALTFSIDFVHEGNYSTSSLRRHIVEGQIKTAGAPNGASGTSNSRGGDNQHPVLTAPSVATGAIPYKAGAPNGTCGASNSRGGDKQQPVLTAPSVAMGAIPLLPQTHTGQTDMSRASEDAPGNATNRNSGVFGVIPHPRRGEKQQPVLAALSVDPPVATGANSLLPQSQPHPSDGYMDDFQQEIENRIPALQKYGNTGWTGEIRPRSLSLGSLGEIIGAHDGHVFGNELFSRTQATDSQKGEEIRTVSETQEEPGAVAQCNSYPPTQATSVREHKSDTHVEYETDAPGTEQRKHVFYIQQDTSSLGESFPTSLLAFLESRHLSNYILLPKERTENNYQSVPIEPSWQVMENTARLALLTTELFRDNSTSIPLGSIQLNDLCIEPQSHSKDDVDDSSRWVLVKIGILPSTRTNTAWAEQPYSEAGAIQNLGKILYSMFTFGKAVPSDLLEVMGREDGEKNSTEADEDIIERFAKSVRTCEISVFSRLMSSDTFPPSVCRLLSDMLDIGPNDKSESLLKSFDNIIEDLDQMISQPDMFLHNYAVAADEGSQLVFGQTNYGREREVSAIMEVIGRMKLPSHETGVKPQNSGVNCVFVSGIAGSGKSFLAQEAVDMLQTSGWIVIKSKFERSQEHASSRIASSMFNELVDYLVKMKNGGDPSDVAYSQRASDAILNYVGRENLSVLSGFLPSLPLLFCEIRDDERKQIGAENYWQLVHCISKVLVAMLEQNRFVIAVSDDLQWADQSALSMIADVLARLGTENSSHSSISQRFIFFGLYRGINPFSDQYSYLLSGCNITTVHVSRLSKESVADMLMAEFRLPRRYVLDLADVVHKKTSGHAFFVVELLNSLLRKSIIFYDVQSQRYSWDMDQINFLKTADNVAELIASNLKLLDASSQRRLQIISCLGSHTDISLLLYLENVEEGLVRSIDTFVREGILNQTGPIVAFAHDLIEEEAYESMTIAGRQSLHLKLGECLGSYAGQLQLTGLEFFGGKSVTSSLISIACDQINCCIEIISDHDKRKEYARWNLSAASQQSNARVALHYCSKGLDFLGQDRWHEERRQLSFQLYNGAVLASFALGEPRGVLRHAQEVEANSTFEESLEIIPFVLKSLFLLGKHEECVTKGIGTLRKLKFDFPLDPTPESNMGSIITTDRMTSQYSIDKVIKLCEKKIDDSVHTVFKIMESIFSSAYECTSQFLPLVTCIIIQYSFHHGICGSSTLAFANFGMLKIFRAGDYLGGKHWGDLVRMIIKEQQSRAKMIESVFYTAFETRSMQFVYVTIDIWFESGRKIAQKLHNYYTEALKVGQIDVAMVALRNTWRHNLLGGEKLSLIDVSAEWHLRPMAKRSPYVAQVALLDCILKMKLSGRTEDIPKYFAVFDGSICSLDDVQAKAESCKKIRLIHIVHCYRLFIAYWEGDLTAAEEHSRLARLAVPASRIPTILLIYATFFRGVVLFQMYRKVGGDQRLNDGKETVELMGKWAKLSPHVFANKWQLLQAEYCFSVKDNEQALNMYQASTATSKDHGNIHELALCYELMGDYYTAQGAIETEIHEGNYYTTKCRIGAEKCYRNAATFYLQWGATAVAHRIMSKHSIEMELAVNGELKADTLKHAR